MSKVLSISASLNHQSKSRDILRRVEKELAGSTEVMHIDFLEDQYANIHCSICDGCQETGICINDLNQKVIDKMKAVDYIVLAVPIYYGGISGKCKAFLESFYLLKKDELKGKKMIVILSSQKKGQEGIAIMELLPWCFKHGIALTHVENVHKGLLQHDELQAVDRISNRIIYDIDTDYAMDLDFGNFNYLDNHAGIPVYYHVKKKNK